MTDVPPLGTRVRVRRNANMHTGGTIGDVTDRLHPAIAATATQASRAIGLAVTGLDFLVPDEWPRSANDEAQPPAQRFIDLLSPETSRR